VTSDGAVQQPAGWYPNGPGIERWWTGTQWGEQVRAASPTPVTQAPRKAVTWQPNHTSHTFHLLMTLFTCGLWLPVWIVVSIINGVTKRRVVTRYR
jgi:hypothetical protein